LEDLGEIVRLDQAYAPASTVSKSATGRSCSRPTVNTSIYISGLDRERHASRDHHDARLGRARGGLLRHRRGFGSAPQHAIAFQKFYEGRWDLQPALGGASTDLIPKSPYSGYLDIHYNSVLQRYVMIVSNDTTFGYAESVDALTWTIPISLGNYGPIARTRPPLASAPTRTFLETVFTFTTRIYPPTGRAGRKARCGALR